MVVTLKDEQLLDSWGLVIEHAAGKQDDILQRIQGYLEQAEVPDIFWQMVAASPGMLKGLLGKRRNYLMVMSRALKDFRMYISAREYGRHLDISWFLTVEPGVFKRAFSSLLTKGEDAHLLAFNLDVFDQQDLRAYVTVVHRYCVKKAIEEFVEELGQETASFDWHSLGFLKVW